MGRTCSLKDPELGKSPDPFIMHLPNMHGSLKSRFISDPREFECTGVFNYNALDIKSVEVQQPDSTQHNFKIVANGDNNFSLFSKDGPVERFDTAMVRTYLLFYQKIHFEHHNYTFVEHDIDSMLNVNPYFILEVVNKEGEHNKVLIHKRRYDYIKLGLDGYPLEWDQDRCWVFLNDGRLTVGQYHVFNKLLRPLAFFIPPDPS